MSKNYSVTISRNSKDMVNIAVKDEISKIRFLELSLTLEDFGWLMTGMSEIKSEGVVKGLQYVGKTKVSEDRLVEYPQYLEFNEVGIRAWIEANCQEEGWLLDSYLGSNGSVKNGVAKYSVYKYV